MKGFTKVLMVGILWALAVLILFLSGVFSRLVVRVASFFVLIVNPFVISMLGDNLIAALLIFALNMAVIIGSVIVFFWWLILIPVVFSQRQKKIE